MRYFDLCIKIFKIANLKTYKRVIDKYIHLIKLAVRF